MEFTLSHISTPDQGKYAELGIFCLVSRKGRSQPIMKTWTFCTLVVEDFDISAPACSSMSNKRRREQPSIDTRLVEIYEDLANVDEDVRLKAAQALLTEFVPDGKCTGEQLNEIVRRLLRGLCSGRKAARLGFSVALTELLNELLGPRGKDVAGVQNVLELIETLKKQSQVSGNVSGQVYASEMSSLPSRC